MRIQQQAGEVDDYDDEASYNGDTDDDSDTDSEQSRVTRCPALNAPSTDNDLELLHGSCGL